MTSTSGREEFRRFYPGRPLGQLFSATVVRRGDTPALLDPVQQLTFRAWRDSARRVAAALRAWGVGPGDRVAYQLPNWWEAAVVFFAGLEVGAVLHPLLPIFREKELRVLLRESRPKVVFVPGTYRKTDFVDLWLGLRADAPGLETLVVCRGNAPAGTIAFDEVLRQSSEERSEVPVDPDSVCLLLYTSGTTSEPKGVLHTHHTLAAEIFSLRRVHGLRVRDRSLVPAPVAHVSGLVHGVLVPALLGTSAVLVDRWDPEHALELVERHRVTYMAGPPTFLLDLVDGAERRAADARSLRLFSCGGADVGRDLVERARRLLPHCLTKRVYGSTEFPTITTTDASDALARGADTEGRPIPPNEVRIVDESGRTLGPGETGEIQARGPECFVGYSRPEFTAEAFTRDGWFRTGDLGFLDDRGYLTVAGRLKEIIVRKGEKFSVREIEESIARHPAVGEVAVVGLPDPRLGERACAVVRLRPGATLSLESLSSFLSREGLAKQKFPERLEIVEEFPRTESGKVDRRRLRAILTGRK